MLSAIFRACLSFDVLGDGVTFSLTFLNISSQANGWGDMSG
jgi:hypothetical protein